jgi:predicted dehydrogenase
MKETPNQVKEIRIAQIGSGFMGKTHSIAYRVLPTFCSADVKVRLTVLADMTEQLASTGARMFGFENWVVGWENIFDYDIDAVDIVTPNDLHPVIAIEAARRGKHVICEKPLAVTVRETQEMVEAVERAGVVNMVCFNYRQIPAVKLARKLIDEGAVGTIYHFRGQYLQDWCADPQTPFVWRFQASKAGSGSLGDIGSHAIDYARYLVGEFDQVVAMTKTFVLERPLPGTKTMHPVDVDDAVNILIRFKNGAVGCLEASRFCHGRKNYLTFEINGSEGSLCFDWEHCNDLLYYSATDGKDRQGYRDIKIGPMHPQAEAFWPIPGINMAYFETAVLQAGEFVTAIADGRRAVPDFRDGLQVAEVMDAVLQSSTSGQWVEVKQVV